MESLFLVLVPFMPLLGSIPLAVAVVLVARMWFRHRELTGDLRDQMQELEARFETLRLGQVELQERAEFAERLLHQFKEGQRQIP